MTKRYAALFLALASAAAALRADVTIRYQSEFKPAAALQPIMEQMMKGALQNSAAISIRMKGGKAYTTAGQWNQIFDLTKSEVTLVDPAHKRYATIPSAQLTDKLAAAMPTANAEQMKAAAQALAAVKTTVDSKVTGHTAEIMGVQAEEREITVSIDLPGMPAQPDSGPGMKLVMHLWTPKQGEALKNPAIRELTAYTAWQKYIMNPGEALKKIAGSMPGLADKLQPLFDEITKNQTVILRTNLEMYMPFLATVAKQMGKGDGPAIDPNAPIITMNQEVTELSTDSLDAALFEVPKDYTETPAEEILSQGLKAQTAAAPK